MLGFLLGVSLSAIIQFFFGSSSGSTAKSSQIMNLVREQASLLIHLRELIGKAGELGFVVTGGELYRTPEQQALHIKNGRSKRRPSPPSRTRCSGWLSPTAR